MPSYTIIVIYDGDMPLDALDREELMERWEWRLLSFDRRVPSKDDPRRAQAEQTGLLTSLDKVIELGAAFCRLNGMYISEGGIMQALERMLTDIECDGAMVEHNGWQPEEGSKGNAEAKDDSEVHGESSASLKDTCTK
ncbi:hypothetical protein MIND_00004600 [Mycena indigotica]|uniref:Uncharacterized protein n=1 Tax=Mycena indigotica TaxID=2126181 RepID=A0A8H6TAG8_9AGAR|nr:uncharacterized protein MIND_00004600 [Mycena indigotica]KAF7314908.1 hypothetical protein MIND_00004600 [Mycena indigotica]